MQNSEVAALARALGHTELRVAETKSSRRWIVECACGFGMPDSGGRPTVTRATYAEAVRTAQWHLRHSVEVHLRDARKNGRVDAIERLAGR